MTSVLLVLWAALCMIPDRTFPLSLVHLASPFALVTAYTDADHWHQGGNLFLRLGYLAGLCALAALGASRTGPRVRHAGDSPAGDGRRGRTVALLLLSVVTGSDGYHGNDPSWPLQ